MKKNKVQGSNWERELIALIAEALGLEKFNNTNFNTAEVGSSRMFNRHLDAEGVDVWFKNLTDIHIQAKKTICSGINTKSIDISSLDRLMPREGLRILATKTTRKSSKREVTTGRYVTLPLEDFLLLLKLWKNARSQ